MSISISEVTAVSGSRQRSGGAESAAAAGSWRADGPRVIEALAQLRGEVAGLRAVLERLERVWDTAPADAAGASEEAAGAERPPAAREALHARVRKWTPDQISRLAGGIRRLTSRCGDLARTVKARWEDPLDVRSPHGDDPWPAETAPRAAAPAADSEEEVTLHALQAIYRRY
jgi:hypothetical protein